VDHGRVLARGTVAELLAVDGDSTLWFTAPLGLDPADPTGPAALTDALATVPRPPGAPAPVARPAPDGHENTYVVTGHVDAHTLAALTAWCAERDVLTTRVSVGRRTLEDVFLDLTGRSLR
jgi:ABC-2 type transport system ATP-binding protein